MKIDKAIEILTSLANRLAHISQADEQTAARLGIEALKAVKSARANNYWTPIPTMPGETEGNADEAH